MRPVIKGLISAFICLHLIAVVLLPNPKSIAVRSFGSWISAYGSTLGVNTPWMFFSPSPAFGQYLAYELLEGSEDEDRTESIEGSHFWPPRRGQIISSLNRQRLLYHSFLTSLSPQRIRDFLVPWLCRLHEGTEGISLHKMSKSVISIEKAQIMGGSFENWREVREGPASDWPCLSSELREDSQKQDQDHSDRSKTTEDMER